MNCCHFLKAQKSTTYSSMRSSWEVRNRKPCRYRLESQAIAWKVLIRVFMLPVEDFIDLSELFRVGNKSSLAVIRQNKEILSDCLHFRKVSRPRSNLASVTDTSLPFKIPMNCTALF